MSRLADIGHMLRTREEMDSRLAVKEEEIRINWTTRWRCRGGLSKKSLVNLCQNDDTLIVTGIRHIIVAQSHRVNLLWRRFDIQTYQ